MPTSQNWQKSSFSGEGNNCVQLGNQTDSPHVLLRESDDPANVLTTSRERLSALLDAIRAERLGS